MLLSKLAVKETPEHNYLALKDNDSAGQGVLLLLIVLPSHVHRNVLRTLHIDDGGLDSLVQLS